MFVDRCGTVFRVSKVFGVRDEIPQDDFSRARVYSPRYLCGRGSFGAQLLFGGARCQSLVLQ